MRRRSHFVIITNPKGLGGPGPASKRRTVTSALKTSQLTSLQILDRHGFLLLLLLLYPLFIKIRIRKAVSFYQKLGSSLLDFLICLRNLFIFAELFWYKCYVLLKTIDVRRLVIRWIMMFGCFFRVRIDFLKSRLQ